MELKTTTWRRGGRRTGSDDIKDRKSACINEGALKSDRRSAGVTLAPEVTLRKTGSGPIKRQGSGKSQHDGGGEPHTGSDVATDRKRSPNAEALGKEEWAPEVGREDTGTDAHMRNEAAISEIWRHGTTGSESGSRSNLKTPEVALKRARLGLDRKWRRCEREVVPSQGRDAGCGLHRK